MITFAGVSQGMAGGGRGDFKVDGAVLGGRGWGIIYRTPPYPGSRIR